MSPQEYKLRALLMRVNNLGSIAQLATDVAGKCGSYVLTGKCYNEI